MFYNIYKLRLSISRTELASCVPAGVDPVVNALGSETKLKTNILENLDIFFNSIFDPLVFTNIFLFDEIQRELLKSLILSKFIKVGETIEQPEFHLVISVLICALSKSKIE